MLEAVHMEAKMKQQQLKGEQGQDFNVGSLKCTFIAEEKEPSKTWHRKDLR